MNLKESLKSYEIGGIGDIKKHTLRFHSYGIGTESGKLTIYAEYETDHPPEVFNGYPAGQKLLIELCNLNLELRGKTLEECAQILIRWSLENIHPYYYYNDDVSQIEYLKDDPDPYWDTMVNVLGCYHIYVVDMVQELEQLYNNTMTVFALRSLIAGNVNEAQRFYGEVRLPEDERLKKDKNLMLQWYRTEPKNRVGVIRQFFENLPHFNMSLEYDILTGQINLQPVVKSVIDAAYYGLGRFAAVNAGAIGDHGGKTNIAFCQACGRAFIKHGNRQKYCGTLECQSVRNNRKASDYYYRKKNEAK